MEMDFLVLVTWAAGIFLFICGFGLLIMMVKCYRKVEQGQAIVRNGVSGTKVSFSGKIVIPIFHRFEIMDIPV